MATIARRMASRIWRSRSLRSAASCRPGCACRWWATSTLDRPSSATAERYLRRALRASRTWSDAEHRMVGGDAAKLLIGRVRPDAGEEGAHLPPPAPEVGPKERRLLVVGDLGRPEGLAPSAEEEPPLAARPEVSHPVRVAPRGHQVATPVDGQEVDRGAPWLARAPPA